MFANIHHFPGPPLPNWFLLPVSLLFALATAYLILRTRGRAARYLLFTCYARYTLGAFHEYTYREAFLGLRWVAIGSILIIAIGAIVLDKRRIFSRPFVPVAAISAIMVVSAIVNENLPAALDPVMRFVIFVLTAVALWQALETSGSAILRRILFVFAQPIVFQIASVVLGIPKSGELDGSLSYIGGYYHEELFSLILVTAFLVAIFANRLNPVIKIGVIALSFAGIYLTDYRTSMLAALPLALVAAFTAGPRAFKASQRPFIRIMIAAAGIAALVLTVNATQDRYSDLGAILQSERLIKPPERYSYADQRVLSSRPFIWSQYLTAYGEAPKLQKVIGFGPDSWVGNFPLYAHNTIVSFLYELGLVGVAALLWLWGSMLRLAFRALPKDRPLLIAGHASFFLLNMATMPHWQIEGNILYGLLCGYTIAKARLAASEQGRIRQQTPQSVEWPEYSDALPSSPFRRG